jgi:alpha-glucosidase
VDVTAYLKVISALLMSLRGSVCLYQGEELGLTEADLSFEDLRDPYGIRFWPEFKGRDGCRTPMVWEADVLNTGFSTERPWLPIPVEHAEKAVSRQLGTPESLLEHYRRFLAFRRSFPAFAKGDIEFVTVDGDGIAFIRRFGNEEILCAFNLGAAPVRLDLDGVRAGQPLTGHELTGSAEGSSISMPGYGAWFGRTA